MLWGHELARAFHAACWRGHFDVLQVPPIARHSRRVYRGDEVLTAPRRGVHTSNTPQHTAVSIKEVLGYGVNITEPPVTPTRVSEQLCNYCS
jgi:hypothetical protein